MYDEMMNQIRAGEDGGMEVKHLEREERWVFQNKAGNKQKKSPKQDKIRHKVLFWCAPLKYITLFI